MYNHYFILCMFLCVSVGTSLPWCMWRSEDNLRYWSLSSTCSRQRLLFFTIVAARIAGPVVPVGCLSCLCLSSHCKSVRITYCSIGSDCYVSSGGMTLSLWMSLPVSVVSWGQQSVESFFNSLIFLLVS